jgi:hypothetical protein
MNYPVVNPQTNIINVGAVDAMGTSITTMGGIHVVPPYPNIAKSYGITSVAVPSANYLAPGVDAQLVPLLEPNSQCSQNEWLVNAQVALQTGIGFVSDMQTPTDVQVVTRLEATDVIDTVGRFAFFRNKPLDPAWGCAQTGTRLVLAVVVRQTPEPVSLAKMDWGVYTTDGPIRILRLADFRYRGMGDYGYYKSSLAIGYQYGPDRIPLTDDDVTISDGFGGATPVDELYITGWGFRKNIGDVGGVVDMQRYFAGKCYSVIGWAIGYGAYTGTPMFALRVDIPVAWTPAYKYYVTAGAPGFISVNIIGYKSSLYFIEGTNGDPGDPNTVWFRLNQVPVYSGRYNIGADVMPTYLRVTQL